MTDPVLAIVRAAHPDGGRVLDAGCGDGAFTVALAEAGYTPVGLDIDLDAIRPVADAHPGIPFFLDDITALDLPFAIVGRGFDVIVLRDVIGHMGLGDIDKTFASCASVVADGGAVVATVPEGSIGTAIRTAAKAGWAEERREDLAGGDIVLVLRHEKAKPSKLRNLLRRR